VKITRRLSHLRFVVVLSVFVAGSMMSLAPSAYAQTIKLAWDPSPNSGVAGYNVYRSQQSGVYSTPLNGSNIVTSAAFTDSGVHSGATYYYVVTTVSTSGVQSGFSNEVLATVPVLTTNKAPVVNAGPDQTITLPAKATLTAAATDDGLPSGVLTYRWSVVSGTGVTLSSQTASSIQASFTAAGTYTFRVTVSDGQLSSSDDVIVTAAWNVTVGSGVQLAASPTSVSPGSTLNATWAQIASPTALDWIGVYQPGSSNTAYLDWFYVSCSRTSGSPLASGSCPFIVPSSLAPGTYQLRLFANNGFTLLATSNNFTAPTLTTNKAPVVSGGTDQTITFPAAATLAATASDDALPNGVLSYLWTVVNGTGVTLSSPTASSTQASFTAAGTYTFRVTVSDGQLSASDDVIVTVQSAPALTLLVSKSGEVLRGAITSIKEYSSSSNVKRLELYIDQNKTATTDASSLTYKWDLRRVSGTHVISGKAYDANNLVVATADLTVSVK
jgi:fibronectin type 3 domain-containing protein